MKKIGVGYWYKVYDLGNSRVLKIEKSTLQKALHSFFKEGMNPITWLPAIKNLVGGRKKVLRNYSILEKILNLNLLGNPKFLEGINYEQDKVEILTKIFATSPEDKNKELIDSYINNILECWENGFADQIYNFTINNGVDSTGRVVLIDFNEVTFSKEKVREAVSSKCWLRSWSTKSLSQSLRDYYLMKMDESLTQETLEELWPKEGSNIVP